MKIPTSKPRKERNRSRRAIKLDGGTTVFFIPETSPLSFLPGGHLIPNQRFIWSAVELLRYVCHVITNVVYGGSQGQNTSLNPKHIPKFKNTSQNPKQVPKTKNTWTFFWILGSVFEFWDVFWIQGSVFGFWDVFWIQGRVFEFWLVFLPYQPRQQCSCRLCFHCILSVLFASLLSLSPPQRPLCIVGRLLCCGKAGEKEKESALSIFSIIDILMGIPSGSLCGGESSFPLERNMGRSRSRLLGRSSQQPRGMGSVHTWVCR